MGKGYILDTNIVIYYLKNMMPEEVLTFVEGKLFSEKPKLSVITEIELLGWQKATEEDIDSIKEFIENTKVLELSEIVKNKTIEIKRSYNIKLPDAVIAATALLYNLELITRNVEDFKNIANLRIKNPWDLI